ncbi:MAG: hypothetical protein K2W82_08790 [Candidatus Obscuribacterales bacterium]|nr:hypothetical protein [Candidatus Obscuribacterales bacterium]
MPAIVNELNSHFREYKIETRWIPQTRHLAFYESGIPTTQKPAQEALIFSADGKVSARQRAADDTAVPNGKNSQETLHGLSGQVVDGLVQRKQQADTLLQTIKINAELIQPKTEQDKQNLAVAQRLAESLTRGRLADMVPVFQRQINPADLPAIAENLEALTKDTGLVAEIEKESNCLVVGKPRDMGDGYVCLLPCSSSQRPVAGRLNADAGGEGELRSLLYRPGSHLQAAETPVLFRDAARAISRYMSKHYYSQFY